MKRFTVFLKQKNDHYHWYGIKRYKTKSGAMDAIKAIRAGCFDIPKYCDPDTIKIVDRADNSVSFY